HNSYRKSLNPFIRSYFNFFVPKKSQGEFIYEHATLTEQLNSGVRGLELDIRASDGGFRIYHFAVFDSGSTAPDFELALEELRIWSKNNPDHVPVTILIEYKPEPWILNTKRDKPSAAVLKHLSETVESVMGADQLITPADIIGGYATMQDAVAANNWPTLGEAKGKFMFLLHYNEDLTPIYIELDPSLKSLSLFPTVESEESLNTYRKYVSHLLFNNPTQPELDDLVRAGYMVRTRIDGDMHIELERRELILNSLAQILTTDYERGRIQPDTDYYVDFGNGKTIKLSGLYS
ncbi:MAG: phosphatidylinositol-specific phospholipase C1-like protein, partial [Clostridiales bacterium]|nr:phosphatidylinositol-specific phospholipase C1-like protein [Clostridiales bacterium]